MPRDSIASSFWRSVWSRGGAWSGRRTFSGCGSNVIATDAAGSTVRRRLNDVELGVNRYLPLGPVRGLLELGIGGRGSRRALGGANLTADLGAGLEVPVVRRVFLRIDERFRETFGNLGPGDRFAYCDRTGCYAYRHHWFANWETLGGVTYSF
jgi:hypothetical protein